MRCVVSPRDWTPSTKWGSNLQPKDDPTAVSLDLKLCLNSDAKSNFSCKCSRFNETYGDQEDIS